MCKALKMSSIWITVLCALFTLHAVCCFGQTNKIDSDGVECSKFTDLSSIEQNKSNTAPKEENKEDSAKRPSMSLQPSSPSVPGTLNIKTDFMQSYWKKRRRFVLLITATNPDNPNRVFDLKEVDANKIMKSFTDRGYENYRVLSGREANEESVLNALEAFIPGDKQDVLVVYFIAHGVARSRDFFLQMPNSQISIKDIIDRTREHFTGPLFLILDSCNSGKAMLNDLTTAQLANTTILTATDSEQNAALLNGGKASAFSYYFTKGLEDDWLLVDTEPDGIIEPEEMRRYLDLRLKCANKAKLISQPMTPKIYPQSNEAVLFFDANRTQVFNSYLRNLLSSNVLYRILQQKIRLVYGDVKRFEPLFDADFLEFLSTWGKPTNPTTTNTSKTQEFRRETQDPRDQDLNLTKEKRDNAKIPVQTKEANRDRETKEVQKRDDGADKAASIPRDREGRDIAGVKRDDAVTNREREVREGVYLRGVDPLAGSFYELFDPSKEFNSTSSYYVYSFVWRYNSILEKELGSDYKVLYNGILNSPSRTGLETALKLLSEGFYDEAIEILLSLTKGKPAREVFLSLGLAQRYALKFPDAVETYNKGLAIFPNDISLMLEKAFAESEIPDHFEQSLSLVTEAVRLELTKTKKLSKETEDAVNSLSSQLLYQNKFVEAQKLQYTFSALKKQYLIVK